MTDRKNNSNRLPGYDYSLPGAYFVTLVAYKRQALFGQLMGEDIKLNTLGEMVREEWLRTRKIRKEVRLDEFVVMPDHLHGILFIDDLHPGMRKNDEQAVGAHGRAHLQRRPGSLGAIVAGYKSGVTTRINQINGTPGHKIWQRNFYDRIIRDQHELDRIREYIHYNPLMLANQNLFDG